MNPRGSGFRNVAGWDRWLRLVLGVIMLGLGWWGGLGELGPSLRIFGFYPLVTALAGWDPFYTLLRVDTRK